MRLIGWLIGWREMRAHERRRKRRRAALDRFAETGDEGPDEIVETR